MCAANAPQIPRDLAFQLEIGRLSEIVRQEHIFGRDGRIGFKLEHPMAVFALLLEERSGSGGNGLAKIGVISESTVSFMASLYMRRGRCQVCCARAGPDGTLDGCREACAGPVACKEEIGEIRDRARPLLLLFGRGGKRRRAFPSRSARVEARRTA